MSISIPVFLISSIAQGSMKKAALDLALVPTGLIILASYHVWLVRRVRREPTRTVMGVNSINRRFWVQSMMEVPTHPLWLRASCPSSLTLLLTADCCLISATGPR